MGPYEWCSTVASAIAIDNRSWRAHARSRRCRRLIAAPVALPTPTMVDNIKAQQKSPTQTEQRADGVYDVRVCPCTPTVMQLIKTDQCQCAGPFGWTVQPAPHYACCLRRQVPGVPCANITQPQVEEKDCEARPSHPPLLRRKGCAIFSISSELDALDPE